MYELTFMLVTKLITTCGIFILFIGVSGGLRDVRVSIPEAVVSGETAVLHCRYDLEHDQLYSFKWYKNKHEFFRYIPKELPHTKIFPLPGVDVDVHRSGPGTLVLRTVSPVISDRYRCEVIADAPTYRTLMKSGYMHVVEVPKDVPELTIEKLRFSPGETLKARCISPPAYPPPNITWSINGYKINSSILLETSENHLLGVLNNLTRREDRLMELVSSQLSLSDLPSSFGETRNIHHNSEGKHETDKSSKTKHEVDKEKKITVSSLVMTIERELVRHNKLKLTCSSNIFNLYNKKSEVLLEIERPHTASILVMATGLSTGARITNHATVKAVVIIINLIRVYFFLNTC